MKAISNINGKMPTFSVWTEFRRFFYALARNLLLVQDILPESFGELLRDSTKGIDKDHAREFADKLVAVINRKIDLPFLNEDQEARLLRVVIDVLVKAMIKNKKLADLLPTH